MLFNFFKNIVTLGPIGYLPAPGTCATIATLISLSFLQSLAITTTVYVLILVLTCILAWHAIVHTLDFFRMHDPSEIVIDEAVGCLVTFLMIPLTLETTIVGCILFRFFDIFKPCGLKKIERMGGAWGILLDDIGAGILSNLILHILFYFSIL